VLRFWFLCMQRSVREGENAMQSNEQMMCRITLQVGYLRTAVYRGVIGGVPVILLRPADWDSCNLFRGGRIYGGSYNEMESYLYFCR